MCQSFVRRWIAKNKMARLRQQNTLDRMAVIIQARWRGYIKRCDYVSRFCSLFPFTTNNHFCFQIIKLLDIISLQCHVRRWAANRQKQLLSKQRDSAIKIQCIARGYIAYTNYVYTLIDVIFCQAIIRSKLARNERSKLRHESKSQHTAAVCIQSKWRSVIASERYLSIVSCAVLAQAFLRRHIARKRFAKIKAYDACRNRSLISMKERESALCIQQGWRGFKRHRFNKSATRIQRQWREHMNCLRSAQATVRSIIFVQATIRRILAVRRTVNAQRFVAIEESENIMMDQREACVALQRWWKKQMHQVQLNKSYSADFFMHNAAAASIVSSQYLMYAYLRLLCLFTHRNLLRCNSYMKQSAFRGYKEFSRYVIISYFILKIVSSSFIVIIIRHIK